MVVRNGKPVFFKSARAKADHEMYLLLLKKHAPKEPIKGAIRLHVEFAFPHLSRTPKRERDLAIYKTTKPDTDNMIKGLKDAMTELGFWLDDAQVCIEDVRKYHYKKPAIYVEIEEIGVSF
jgi:Holliday junction resolvase RusA-like endonuclease